MSGNDVSTVQAKRKTKVGTLVSAYIEENAYNALLKHCEVTGQSKTKAIERAILKYCGNSDKENVEE
jgi:hypothetical protein